MLIDLAEESESSAAFEAAVKEMFFDVNILREEEWLAAVDEVRRGKVELDIQQESADSESYVRVEFTDLAHVLPADNYPQQAGSALAA